MGFIWTAVLDGVKDVSLLETEEDKNELPIKKDIFMIE